MSVFRIGDTVTVTIKGEVTGTYLDNITVQEERSGVSHYLSPDGVTSVEKHAPAYVPGKAYVDADGDVCIRLAVMDSQGRVWVDAYGNLATEDWVTLPVKELVEA